MDYITIYELALRHISDQTNGLQTDSHGDEPVIELMQTDAAAIAARFAFKLMKPSAN